MRERMSIYYADKNLFLEVSEQFKDIIQVKGR